MGLLSRRSNTVPYRIIRSSKNMSDNSDLISKNLVTMGKHLEEQNSIIISRLDDICKMLYDLTKKNIENNK